MVHFFKLLDIMMLIPTMIYLCVGIINDGKRSLARNGLKPHLLGYGRCVRMQSNKSVDCQIA